MLIPSVLRRHSALLAQVLIFLMVLHAAAQTQPAAVPTTAPATEPAAPRDQQIDALVDQLSRTDWRQRDAAQAQLMRLGPGVEQPLRRRLEGKLTPEERTRIEAIVRELQRARVKALVIQSMGNMARIERAIIAYRNEHADANPATLDDVKPYLGPDADKALTNPRYPERKIGYVYVQSGKRIADVPDPTERANLYEAFDEWGDGISVGFADGHAEFVSDRAQFEQALKPRGRDSK